MAQTKERKAQIDLLNAFVELAPEQYDRDRIREMCAEMHKSGESDRVIGRSLAGAIYDGLAYGNWPSAVRKLTA